MDLLQLQGVWFQAPAPAVAGPGVSVGTWLLMGVGRCWWFVLLMGL